MATVTNADAIVWCAGDMSIQMKPIEAKSEKTPMTETTRELRGIDFQNSALMRGTCEFLVRFGIVFLLNSGTHNLTGSWFSSGDEMHGQTVQVLVCWNLVFCYRQRMTRCCGFRCRMTLTGKFQIH